MSVGTQGRAIRIAVSAILAAGLLAAGCGDDEESGDAADDTSAVATDDAVAADVDAKIAAREAVTAMEVYFLDNGAYAGADYDYVVSVVPEVEDAELTISGGDRGFVVAVTSSTGTVFQVARDDAKSIEFRCEPPGEGGCPDSGDWSE